ncbi:hypothetical protein COB64_04495 [Candidatus Wolfebacteria bacterium]|nr:MAG: hypothetical protein COB64_04495 [Candidatus Wolfebacteria bacterium]
MNLNQIRKRKTALYIQTPITRYSYFSPIIALLFEDMFSTLMSDLPEEDDLDVLCLIDECPVLKIPSLQKAISNVRKYRTGILISVQNYSQLQQNYGQYEAESIQASCFGKLYLPGQPMEICKELESLMGKYEFKDKQGRKTIMPIMTADQIRTMPVNHGIFIARSQKPMILKLKPYYEQWRLKAYSEIPSPIIRANFIKEVPLIPLSQHDQNHKKESYLHVAVS